MSRKCFIENVNNWFTIVTALGCLFIIPSTVTAFEINQEICAGASVMPLNASIRGHGAFESRSHYFKLEVPTAGLVTLDVAVPGAAGAEAKIGLFRRGCGDSGAGRFALVEQTPAGLVLMAEAPGTYVFAVAAQDAKSSLSAFRVTAGFVSADVFNPDAKGDGPAFSRSVDEEGESDDEIEIEPNIKGDESGFRNSTGGKEKGQEPKIDKKRSQPRRVLPPGDILRLVSRKLCQRLETDDHGDTSICATQIRPGQRAGGDLSNSWGDDHDLFVFTLTTQRTVHLTTTGAVDTFGGLYDRRGHSLATDDDGGKSDNFRIVKTLSPGTYFVRVEGSYGAEGAYGLVVEARSW